MIIGDTIENLQGNLSEKEVVLWCAYRSKFGPLNPIRKYDGGHAIVASVLANVNGLKKTPADFMPYGKEKEPDIEVDGSKFLELLMGTGNAKRGR